MGNINKAFGTKVYFSDGNTKMGAIPSVSLPPIKTCHNCSECSKKCYARRIYQRLSVVKKQYDSNLKLLHKDRNKYFDDINTVLKYSNFFRWHVAGDIVDYDYFVRMCKLAEDNPNCVQLVFTKDYKDVNKYLSDGGTIPENLHVIFSVWKNTPYENPYNLPECHIRYRNGETTAGELYYECAGNCFKCFFDDKGCVSLEYGEQIVINEH